MCHPYPGVAAPAARLSAQVLLFVPRVARICARAFRARPAARCRKIQTRGFATVVERRSSKEHDETALPPDVRKDSDLPRNTRKVMWLHPSSPFDTITVYLHS